MASPRRDIFKTSTELPQSARKLRGKKKRSPLELLGLLCFALLVLVTLFVLLMRLEALQIRSVEVSGTEALSSQEVQERVQAHLEGFYFLLIPKTNIFFYPERVIAADLIGTYSRIETLKISAGFDRMLNLDLRERHLAYLLCDGEGFTLPCFSVDSTGYLFDTAPSFSRALVPLYRVVTSASSTHSLGETFLDPYELFRTKEMLAQIAHVLTSHEIDVALYGIELSPEGDYAIVFRQGGHEGRIWFREGSPADIARILDLALGNPAFGAKASDFSRLEKLDLRFGKKVYYSFVGHVEEDSATSTRDQ